MGYFPISPRLRCKRRSSENGWGKSDEVKWAFVLFVFHFTDRIERVLRIQKMGGAPDSREYRRVCYFSFSQKYGIDLKRSVLLDFPSLFHLISEFNAFHSRLISETDGSITNKRNVWRAVWNILGVKEELNWEIERYLRSGQTSMLIQGPREKAKRGRLELERPMWRRTRRKTKSMGTEKREDKLSIAPIAYASG